jgi:hypothetical protein
MEAILYAYTLKKQKRKVFFEKIEKTSEVLETFEPLNAFS